MKKYLSLIGVLLLSISCATSNSIVPESYKLPKYKTVQLDNGMEIIVVPDKSIPFVSMSLMLPVGFVGDPMAKSGLSSLVGSMLEKGSEKRSAAKIADELDFMGVNYSASVGGEYSVLSIDGMSKYENEILNSFNEILFKPSFPKKELKSLKKRLIAAIQKRKDNPGDMASLYAKRFLYGNHPFAKTGVGEIKDIKSIGRKDLVAHYKKKYVPEGAVLAITGNFSSNFQGEVQKAFSKWKGKAAPRTIYPLVKDSERIEVRLMAKSSLKQAQVRLLHLGPGRKTEDYLALRIANTILGGGFSSRLMDEIRDNRGLTYGIYSGYSFGRGVGTFEISTFTRNEKVGELLETTLGIYRKMFEDGITEEELSRAKNAILGKFPRAVETTEKLAGNLLLLRAYGVQDNYLHDYVKNIQGVSLSEVNMAIKKYMKPESLKILVYSPEKPVRKQLQPIGLLEVKNVK